MAKLIDFFKGLSKKTSSDPSSILEPTLQPPVESIAQSIDIPQPELIPQPIATPQPEPIPQPIATPQPEPIPQPVATPQPEPIPQPVATPQPQPIATPQPVATPQPQPELIPQPVMAPNLVQTFAPSIASSLNVFTPLPELIAIATQLSNLDITKEYGMQIEQLAYQPDLKKSQLSNFITPIIELSENYSKALLQIKDPVDILAEYHESCISLSHYTLPTEVPTYENFLEVDGFEKFKKSILILLNFKKIFPSLFSDPSLNLEALTQEYSVAMATLNQLTPQVQALRPVAETLSTEIINFTNTVNQVQSKNKMSADWNGKKQPLMQFRQQLVERREKFVEDESKINEIISTLYTKCIALHDQFRKLCPTFVNVIKQLIDSTPRDPNIMAKRQQIERISQTLSTARLQLEAFLNTLSE